MSIRETEIYWDFMSVSSDFLKTYLLQFNISNSVNCIYLIIINIVNTEVFLPNIWAKCLQYTWLQWIKKKIQFWNKLLCISQFYTHTLGFHVLCEYSIGVYSKLYILSYYTNLISKSTHRKKKFYIFRKHKSVSFVGIFPHRDKQKLLVLLYYYYTYTYI